MKRNVNVFAIVLLSFLLASCAVWTRLEDARLDGPDGLSLQAPAGWMRFNMAGDRVISLTRDGFQIQTIRIEYRKHDKAFPAIKKPSTPDMLASEAAELLLADLRADPALANIKMIDNVPARVAGKTGFRFHGQYRNERGAPFDLVAVGRTTKNGLVVAFYRSLTAHYYQRDLPQFEKTLASLVVSD